MASADMCEHEWPGTGCEECKAEAQAEPAPAQDEREAFEVACMTAGLVRPGNYCPNFDRYVSERVQGRYEGFKLGRATRPAQTEQQHPDDAAVDRFAAAMKAKLAKSRAKGRGGWDDPNVCSVEFLAQLLVEHLGKGNTGTFEDVANFAMMLHQRGADPKVLAEAAAPQAEQQPKEEIPKPEGWVAAGRFFTDRGEAIAAAEKTPCVDVYLRPSLLTILARSAERQSVAEELARLLSQANCDIRQLNAAAPIAQTALQPEQSRPANKLRALAEIWDQNADEADEFGNAQAAEALRLAAFELRAALSAQGAAKFRMGDLVKKSTGSEWIGRVVGWYSTEQTKEGYAVESSAHRNSVQIYPAKALELVPMAAKEA